MTGVGRVLSVMTAAGMSQLGIGALAAAETRPGGPLELIVSGFAAFQVHGGELDDQRREPAISTGLDFSNDTEVHLLVRGTDEATGIDYGGTVEFAADTNDAENTAKSWIFVRGGLGELRLGDEEGPVEESALGGFTVAAGTGGIDGEVIDELAVGAVLPTNTDAATKLRYYTPSSGGLQLGIGYTPAADDQGQSLAATDVEAGDWFEGALTYRRELEDLEVATSLVGSWGKVKDQGGFGGKGEIWTWFAGATAAVLGAELGAGFGEESVGTLDRRYVNAGIAYDFDEVTASLTHGRVLRARNYTGVGEPWNLVASAGAELAPGLMLAGDVAYFVNDLDSDAEEPTGGDRGWAWVARLELAF